MVSIKKASLKDAGQQELMDLIKQGLTSGEGPLKDIFGKFDLGEFEQGIQAPALKNFKETILPGILENFSGQGQAGGSGMQRAAIKGGTDLQSRLSELLYNAQQGQKQNRLAGLQSHIGQNTVENIIQPPKESALSTILPVAGGIAGSFLGGPGGGAIGSALASKLTSAKAGGV